MYFFYIDESGNSGTQIHPVEPVHWLVSVGVHARAVRSLEVEMLALATRFFGARAYDPDFEFHGAELFTGRSDSRALPPSARVELYQALAGMLSRHGCGVFVCGIEKARYRVQATGTGSRILHPHALGFGRLLERINGWLACRQPSCEPPANAPDPVLGLLVADEQKEVERQTVHSFTRWRDLGIGESRSDPATRFLIDTVHYIPSMDSWLLQLADCVAYLRNRYEKVVRLKIIPGHPLTQADREIVNLWERFCAPVVQCEDVWP